MHRTVPRAALPIEKLSAQLIDVEKRKELCDSGSPDVDECAAVFDTEPPSMTPVEEALVRGRWLLGLLVLQSSSSFILDRYQDLLKEHVVVVLFLTMLVGAGGNAGNQSAIKVIRALATGQVRPSWSSFSKTISEQAQVALMLGSGLAVGGYLRVYATNGDSDSALAISLSLFLIVVTSILLGTALPFILARRGIDPANAGTTIQVLMDILGVLISCVTCSFILDTFLASLSEG